ncbi:hypothetical protein [Nonomuraea zeae]|uniref:Uncharacterized protein n=1 Tax=Nonomuraea zeae TaxID=1642303 RepID=A0A5S4GAH4_9ACTN|nr:hypothetical protein [Nonomuraea zeae]TMR29872.1 hypothetical protein ETD85_31075 [Nonomuraea zeae]
MRKIGTSARPIGLLLAFTLTILCGALTGTASAAVPGLQIVSVTSSSNSDFSKGVFADCPSGKQVLGAGGSVNQGGSKVVMDQIVPSSGLTRVTVSARETEAGLATNWSVTAYAICANPVAGLERVTATWSADSSAAKNVTGSCPAGKNITGIGGSIGDGEGEVLLETVAPLITMTSGRTSAAEDTTGFAGDWSLTTYAICASPLPGQQVVVTHGPDDSAGIKDAQTACTGGTRTIGVGGAVSVPPPTLGAQGKVVMSHVVPVTLPHGALSSGNEVAGQPSAFVWHASAYAVCATP